MTTGKKYVYKLWQLSRIIYKNKFLFSRIDNTSLLKDKGIPQFDALSSKPGKIQVYQSHSQRAVWLFNLWKSDAFYYPGIEYKGIGYNGGQIKSLGKFAWGGVEKQRALDEHYFSKVAIKSGAFCQRPIACYNYGSLNGMPLAVIVRSFISPLRLSNFHFDKTILKQYLELRQIDEAEYCRYLGNVLGRSVRCMFDAKLYHGSMEINNITSEGEIADFEPTYGGTWEGLMKNTEPKFQVLALHRLFSAIENLSRRSKCGFINNFAHVFLRKEVSLSNKKPEVEIIEEYINRLIDDEELVVKLPSLDNLKDIVDMLKVKLRESCDKNEKKQIQYIIRRLS
ncbi:MAG: hypothetical protein V1934_04710 [Methanobacteriota archaeon]